MRDLLFLLSGYKLLLDIFNSSILISTHKLQN
jgi:hypothetical protein